MSRRQRLNARYARILAIGLGISLLVHGAVLAVGRLIVPLDGSENRPLMVIDLAEPQPPEESRDAARDAADKLAAAYVPAVELSPTPVEDEATAPVEFSDYRLVLARLEATALTAPMVPRPRLTAETVESGLTPIHVTGPLLLAGASAPSGSDSGSGGIGIVFTSGPGACAPGYGSFAALPNRRAGVIPRAGSIQLRPAGFRGR